jgi:hypothetical protein
MELPGDPGDFAQKFLGLIRLSFGTKICFKRFHAKPIQISYGAKLIIRQFGAKSKTP